MIYFELYSLPDKGNYVERPFGVKIRTVLDGRRTGKGKKCQTIKSGRI